MPILRKHKFKNYYEGYEELDEHSPFFDPYIMEEKEIGVEENPKSEDSFWRKWWDIFKVIFFKF